MNTQAHATAMKAPIKARTSKLNGHVETKLKEPRAEHADPKLDEAYAKFQAARDALLEASNAAPWKRMLCNTLIALVASATTYAVGVSMTELLVAGAMALTNSGFIGLVIAFIGLVLTGYAAWIVFNRTYDFATSFEASSIKSSVLSAKNKVFGFFATKGEQHA